MWVSPNEIRAERSEQEVAAPAFNQHQSVSSAKINEPQSVSSGYVTNCKTATNPKQVI
ncbi:hypothetical protein PM8797T_04070 [Gimesia maris DSM 8797]|uniref:Uncharacterized protein n=1 Tax=Gimesia maris TaxID=122 RepID=A0ABX5YHM4_9PLAN|nr:hypothetical protein PM8797T_04070 [Gimesia maris DSM 8797]QEG15150.1 hypothetical protein GmarT_09880 [Gimesia maris]